MACDVSCSCWSHHGCDSGTTAGGAFSRLPRARPKGALLAARAPWSGCCGGGRQQQQGAERRASETARKKRTTNADRGQRTAALLCLAQQQQRRRTLVWRCLIARCSQDKGRRGNLDAFRAVQLLLSPPHNADPNWIHPVHGATCLLRASERGHVDCLRPLLDCSRRKGAVHRTVDRQIFLGQGLPQYDGGRIESSPRCRRQRAARVGAVAAGLMRGRTATGTNVIAINSTHSPAFLLPF